MKIKKIMMCLITILLSTFFMANNVKAENIYIGDYVKPTFYYKHKKGSYISYQTAQYIIRRSDGAFVYCVQPLLRVDADANYQVTENDYETILNITPQTWLTLSKIAFYGYGYSVNGYDHTSSKWYVATQMLIWQTVDPTVESYFTSSLNGSKNDTILREEMDEILDLVSKHNIYPNFTNVPSTLNIGDTINLIDTNGVLNIFDLVNIKGGLVSKNGNNLSITATEVGNISFSLQKLLNLYGEKSKLYYAKDAQAVTNRGNLDPINVNFNIQVLGGKVTINKVDSGTLKPIPEGSASLKDAIYGIYKSDGTKVGELVTDANGNATSGYLPSMGNYYIQEIKSSLGYKVDTTRYNFTISADNLNPTIQVREQVIKNRIKVLKQYDYVDGTTQFLNAEAGIVFEIYDSNNIKYSEIVTDKNGYAEIELPYGVYKFHQKNTNTGFNKIYDFFITIDENSEEMQYYNILNNKMSAYLQVVKVDAETGETIAIADTTFKILNTDTNQYVSQYVGGKVYSEFKTDEKGILVTPLKLEAGNYKLIEISSPYGYLLSLDDLTFSIGEDTYYNYTTYGAFVTIRFENTPIKGQLEIHKKGEKLKIENSSFYYEEKPLEEVVFKIYAKEDIFSADGRTLYYKKDELVDILTTDKNGYAISKKLHLGSYYVVEVKTEDDYVLDTKKYEFILEAKDSKTPIVYESYSALNYLKKGNLEFTKTDLVSGEVIPNTIIEIYTDDNKLIFVGATDKEGKISIKNLKVGKYYIIEKEPSTGYVLTDEKVYFEIKESEEIVKANMTNEKIKSIVKIHKVDENGNILVGVEIGIFNLDGNLIGSYFTDANGNIEIELEYGSYYYQELKTIDGYILNEEKVYFDVIENEAIIEKTLVNEKEKPNIPNVPYTGKTDLKLIDLGSLFLIVLGAGYIIYAKKNKN